MPLEPYTKQGTPKVTAEKKVTNMKKLPAKIRKPHKKRLSLKMGLPQKDKVASQLEPALTDASSCSCRAR